MLNALFIGGEALSYAGLAALIDTSIIDVHFLPRPGNTEEAINTLMVDKPEVVVIDTSSLNEDEIHLIERVKTAGNREQILIILADTRDFEKTREAFRHGVFDYLVKNEISQLSWNDCLLKASECLEKDMTHRDDNEQIDKQIVTRTFYMRLLSDDVLQEDPTEVMRNLGIKFTYPWYTAIVFTTVNREKTDAAKFESMNSYIQALIRKKLNNGSNCYVLQWTNTSFCAIMGTQERVTTQTYSLLDNLKEIRSEIDNKLSCVTLIGVGTSVSRLREMNVSFLQGRNACRYTSERTPLLFYDQVEEYDGFNQEAFINDWIDALENLRADRMDELVEEFTAFIENKDYHLNDITVFCSDILHISIRRMEGLYKSLQTEYTDLACPTLSVSQLRSTEDIVNWFNILCKHIKMRISEQGKEKQTILVDAMKKYIEEHWNEQLSLRIIADVFHFSTSYVSRLFRLFNNCGFADYITKVKIEHSRDLLAIPGTTVSKVAEELGYDDPYYFSKVFKKFFNVSPKEYIISLNMSEKSS